MEWITVVLVSSFALFGSVYCLWSIRAAWREARRLPHGRVRRDGNHLPRWQGMGTLAVLGIEFGLAVTFIVGAMLVTLRTADTQGASPSWRSGDDQAREYAEPLRFCTGPNGSRLVFACAGSRPGCPIVFVDATCQLIRDGDLDDIAERFPELEGLLLGQTQVTDEGLARLSQFQELESLSLQNLPITNGGLRHLEGLGGLTFLDLAETGISDPGLAVVGRLGGIDELRLCHTQVSDAGLRHLQELRNLRYLDVSETNVTERGVDDLQRRLPCCTIKY